MKKQLFLFSIITLSAYALYGMSSNQIIQTLISTHTRAFDKKNTYNSRIDNSDINDFNTVINEAENFIVNNSVQYKIPLLTYFYHIKNANYQLVNEIKIAYGQLMAGKPVITVYQQEAPIFTSIDTNMQDIRNQLKLMTSNTESERQAIQLVGTAAQLIGVTARKAKNNLEIFQR